jgi:hypothetical protein
MPFGGEPPKSWALRERPCYRENKNLGSSGLPADAELLKFCRYMGRESPMISHPEFTGFIKNILFTVAYHVRGIPFPYGMQFAMVQSLGQRIEFRDLLHPAHGVLNILFTV